MQTSKYSGAIFKSFKTSYEAQAFVNAHSQVGSTTARKRPRDDDKMVTAVVSSTTQTSSLSSNATKQISPNNNAQLQITIHFDGGSRGNPGLAGSGAEVVVTDTTSKTTTYLIREYVGTSETNNYAEYKGLIAGLHKAKTCIEQYKTMKQTHTTSTSNNRPLFHLQFYGDSKLVIEQLRGTWRCKHPNLQLVYQLCQKIIHEIKQMDANSTVTCDHVYREQNKIADGLANEAMDKKRSWTTTTESTTVDKNDDDDDDERKQAAVPVSKKRKSGSVWEAEKGRDVIDVDDSDESYNC